MALLQVNNLIKFFGSVPLLTGVSLEINPGEKWGLIGKNGCGKTTLINILTQTEDYDQGEIHWSQNCRIGYLQQEPVFTSGSLYRELRTVFQDLDEAQSNLRRLQKELDHPALDPVRLNALVAEYSRLNDEFEQNGGYRIEGQIQGVLRGLEFPKERWEDPPQKLSGGERTRLALARILLTRNDILFLDEPTNYLDIAAIEWLEDYLRDYRGAVLVVSHDRYFLDRVVQGFLEIEAGRINRFRGNYTAYRQQKTALYEATFKSYLQQEKRLTKLEKFVRESRATEKSKRQAHSIERRMAKEERIARPLREEKKLKMEFTAAVSSGKKVLEVEGLGKSFDTKLLLDEVNLTIRSGEKIGLVGPNGAGKTTLLKLILGEIQPDRGFIRLGYEVYPGYFSQLTADEDLEGTPFDQVMAAADLDNTEARTILGRFLFSGDSVFKKVTALSGGERRRLGLIKLMLSRANFLIMDEPTNHLDLQSIEIMEAALREYPGTLMVVSHDRYFLNEIADRYLALSQGSIYEFASYREYLEWRQTAATAKPDDPAAPERNPSQMRRELNKENQRMLRRKQKELAEIESAVARLETEQAEVFDRLNDPEVHTDYQRSMELSEQLAALETSLDELYRKWEACHEELNRLAIDN
jgi:ATP-binding cassette subfamily F protein 3